MPDSIDEELLRELKTALKRQCYFALITKGPVPLKLLVQRRPLKMGDVRAMKKECGGKQVFAGTCEGEGGKELLFTVDGKEPKVPESRFKKFVQEQTGLLIAPRFALSGEAGESEEEDFEE